MNEARTEIERIVVAAVKELNAELGYAHLAQPTLETTLYTGDDALDSLSLVTLIVDIEERVADAFDCELLLASEKAMSQDHSPYRTIGSLVDFASTELAAHRTGSACTRNARL